jgi:hypothetical protein
MLIAVRMACPGWLTCRVRQVSGAVASGGAGVGRCAAGAVAG